MGRVRAALAHWCVPHSPDFHHDKNLGHGEGAQYINNLQSTLMLFSLDASAVTPALCSRPPTFCC